MIKVILVAGFFLVAGICLEPCIFAASEAGEEFLRIEAGVRAVGMGGAFCSIADDMNAVNWNPAGLPQLEGNEISFMYLSYLAGINTTNIGYAGSFSRGSGLGANLSFLHMAETIMDESGLEAGVFVVNELLLSAGYAYWFDRNVSLGVGLKTIFTSFDTDMTSGIGIEYKTPIYGLNAGTVIQNIDTRIKYTEELELMPLNVRAGVSYRLLDENLILAMDISEYVKYGKLEFHIGVEFETGVRLDSGVVLRLGYNTTNTDEIDKMTGLSAGIGIHSWKSGFDYAWVPHGVLDDVHRVSFTVKF
jgi:hypothetical protein